MIPFRAVGLGESPEVVQESYLKGIGICGAGFREATYYEVSQYDLRSVPGIKGSSGGRSEF